MRYFIWNRAGVFTLLLLFVVGCGSSTSEGAGGAAGTGGTAGTGGSGGAPAPPGLWAGSGQGGADGSFTICFNVSDDGSAIGRSLDTAECGGFSLGVRFDTCEAGSFSTTDEIPIVDGVFRWMDPLGGASDIRGTFDGDTASGTAVISNTLGTCSGSWTATPSP